MRGHAGAAAAVTAPLSGLCHNIEAARARRMLIGRSSLVCALAALVTLVALFSTSGARAVAFHASQSAASAPLIRIAQAEEAKPPPGTEDELNQLIAGSKFKDMPRFAKEKTGYICLQNHGGEVWFRNIRIRGLTKH